MGTFKKKLKSVVMDASHQQSVSQEMKRSLAKLKKKVNHLEEREEGINIESLEGKQTISVDDILEVLKTFRSETTSTTVSVEEMQEFRAEVNSINERLMAQE